MQPKDEKKEWKIARTSYTFPKRVQIHLLIVDDRKISFLMHLCDFIATYYVRTKVREISLDLPMSDTIYTNMYVALEIIRMKNYKIGIFSFFFKSQFNRFILHKSNVSAQTVFINVVIKLLLYFPSSFYMNI